LAGMAMGFSELKLSKELILLAQAKKIRIEIMVNSLFIVFLNSFKDKQVAFLLV
jgi:hypothetical protein